MRVAAQFLLNKCDRIDELGPRYSVYAFVVTEVEKFIDVFDWYFHIHALHTDLKVIFGQVRVDAFAWFKNAENLFVSEVVAVFDGCDCLCAGGE